MLNNTVQTPTTGFWLLSAIFTALAIGTYWPIITRMAQLWMDPNANMEHGIVVPFTVAFIIYYHWPHLVTVPRHGSWLGLLFLVANCAVLWIAVSTDIRFLERLSFLIAIASTVILLFGFDLLRALAFPFLLLLLMIPPPTFLHDYITLPLQMIASSLAEHGLEVLGFTVLRQGNIIELVGEKLEIAEACSGIKSLSALMFFALVYNHFLVPTRALQLGLLFVIVPICIISNSLRILLTAVVGQYDRALAHSSLHELSGYVFIIVSAVLFWLFHQFIRRLRTSITTSLPV